MNELPDRTYNSTSQLVNSSRRRFLKTSGFGAGSLALTGVTGSIAGFAVVPAPACNPKNLSTYVSMIAGGFVEVKVLLPDLGLSSFLVNQISGYIDKGLTIARQFDEAYKAGKFTDASTLFTNLGSLLTQVITTLGIAIDNQGVKAALAAIAIARIAIAILLQKQAQSRPEVLAAAKSKTGAEAVAVSEIERLAATDLSKVLETMKVGP